jgi:DNA-binding response OmpR family regulator
MVWMSGTKRTGAADLNGANVLLLDSDPRARTTVTAALRGVKCSDIVLSADGTRALEMLAEREIALVVMDIRMPEPAGLAFLRRLRQTPSGTMLPVIIITSSENPEEACHARELGAFAWLMKPLEPASLVSCALAALRRGRLRPGEAPMLAALCERYEQRLPTALEDVAHKASRVKGGHLPFNVCAEEMVRDLNALRTMSGLLGYTLVEEICSQTHDLHRACVLHAALLEPHQMEVTRLTHICISLMMILAGKRLRGSAGPAGLLISEKLRPLLLNLQAKFDELISDAQAKAKEANDAMATRRAEIETEAWRLQRVVTLDAKSKI